MIVTGESVIQWMRKKCPEEFGSLRGQSLGWLKDGELIAGVAYTDYNGVNISMHVYGEGNWLKRQFLWAAFDYPFNQLNLKRVTGVVGEGNNRARRFDEHLGFKLEARLKDAHPTGDLLIYSMFKDECRFLKGYKDGWKIIHASGT